VDQGTFRLEPVPAAATQIYIMAASPPKEPDVEQTQSGEDEEQMSRQEEAQGGGLGDFEVKEQDRWLPIANGWSFPIPHVSPHGSQTLICPYLT